MLKGFADLFLKTQQQQTECDGSKSNQKEKEEASSPPSSLTATTASSSTTTTSEQQQHKKTTTTCYHYRKPGDVEIKFDWFNYLKDNTYTAIVGTNNDNNNNNIIIDNTQGNEDDYKKRYIEEDKILGQGQYGYVKLIHDNMIKKTSTSSASYNTNNNNNNNADANNSTMIINDNDNDNDDDDDDDDVTSLRACKVLRKGITFQDNTLYAPISPELLKNECDILRTLNGQHYCLKLYNIYESNNYIYLVTELCSTCSNNDGNGITMMDYIDKISISLRSLTLKLKQQQQQQLEQDEQQQQQLEQEQLDEQQQELHKLLLPSIEDVSRISYQLIDAISWCHSNNIIHRDVKPDNIMFKQRQQQQQQQSTTDNTNTTIQSQLDILKESDLRLIDFGSSCIDKNKNEDNTCECFHTTFIGSPFYVSPEMYQSSRSSSSSSSSSTNEKKRCTVGYGYTNKTDLWSIGVTLYVLVGGYPPCDEQDEVQKTFNILHNYKHDRNLKENLPFPNLQLQQQLLLSTKQQQQEQVFLMPDSYYEMLNELLNYKHKQRKSANDMLLNNFITLWRKAAGAN